MNNMRSWKKQGFAGVISLLGTCAAALVMACPSVDSPETKITRYAISIAATINGTVTADRKTAEAGETVTLYVTPGKRYGLGSIAVTGVSGVGVDLGGDGADPSSSGVYTFTMPGEDVDISAVFTLAESSSDLKKFEIIVNIMVNGTFELIPSGSQYETLLVTLMPQPEPGNKYRPGSLKVRGKDSKEEIKTEQAEDPSEEEWTFEMPGEDVEIDADFIDEETELYDIIIAKTANGAIHCGQSNAVAGDTVTITLIPDEDYHYLADSFTITPGVENLTETSITGDDNKAWTFTMPEEAVHITASFAAIPRYAIIQGSIEHGTVTIEPSGMVKAGTEVYIRLDIDDPENYRYVQNSMIVSGTGTGEELHLETAGELAWTFIMPEEAVTVNTALEFIPFFDITVHGAKNGSIMVDADKAREGAAITVTAIPHPGYKVADSEPIVSPAGAVSMNRQGQGVWIFEMTEQDIEISIGFTELGLLEIYKGGARKGITVGALSDDNKYYENSIELEAEEPGRNGNSRVMKISHALNTSGNTVQQSFGLFSDTEIDLEHIAALSFWAKSNKALNIRFTGFGDADLYKRVVYTGEGFNQSIPITTEWKRYIVPVPAPINGQTTTRVFMFNASLTNGNYVCIDDIEFIESGVALSEISITDANDSLFYGYIDMEKIMRGAPVKLVYTCDDGTTVTLHGSSSSHTLKHNLSRWLLPFTEINGSTHTPLISLNIDGIRSNTMSVHILDGISIDDFEDGETETLPSNPAAATGYIWHNSASGSIITRDYINAANDQIHSGLRAGNWRPTATANNPRGGRNFEEKDLSSYNMIVFRIRVITGPVADSNYHKNTVFTFELKNGGTLTDKTKGDFFAQEFTYNTDGWQEVKMKLSDFVYTGSTTGETPLLDITAVTGYAFNVVDRQGAALRIALDDIAAVFE